MKELLQEEKRIICNDKIGNTYYITYRNNCLFTNRINKKLPNKTNGKDNYYFVDIETAVSILESKGIILGDIK
jgi:hypothetical protein